MNWGTGLPKGGLRAANQSRCHTVAKGRCRSRPAQTFAGAIADPLLIANRKPNVATHSTGQNELTR